MYISHQLNHRVLFLQNRIVKGITKFTIDCSKLKFIDARGEKLNISELSSESNGIHDRKAFFDYQSMRVNLEDMDDRVTDGIMASIEKCSVTLSFCDSEWKDKSTFKQTEDIYVKLTFTNETEYVAVACVTCYQFGRGCILVEIKDDKEGVYKHYCNQSHDQGAYVPIAPGKSYTFRRGLTRKSKRECDKYSIRYVTPPPGSYKAAVVNESSWTERKFTFEGESSFTIIEP